MNRLRRAFGNLIFVITWVPVHFYLKNTLRTRVIVYHGSKLLVVRNWVGSQKLSLLGGGVHAGETSHDGAIREIKEEAGLDIATDKLKLLKPEYIVSEFGTKYRCQAYSIEVLSDTELIKQNREIMEIRWIDYRDLLANYKLSKNTKELIATWSKENHLLDLVS
jgi:8-oxo-dGTP pyrophosphatase MutT (NUDIX family)